MTSFILGLVLGGVAMRIGYRLGRYKARELLQEAREQLKEAKDIHQETESMLGILAAKSIEKTQ